MFWLELKSRDPHYVLAMSRERLAVTRKHVQESLARIRKGAVSRRRRSRRHLSPPDREYVSLLEWLEQDGAR